MVPARNDRDNILHRPGSEDKDVANKRTNLCNNETPNRCIRDPDPTIHWSTTQQYVGNRPQHERCENASIRHSRTKSYDKPGRTHQLATNITRFTNRILRCERYWTKRLASSFIFHGKKKFQRIISSRILGYLQKLLLKQTRRNWMCYRRIVRRCTYLKGRSN